MTVTIYIYHSAGRCVKCRRMEEIAREVSESFPGRVEVVLQPIDQAPPELGVVMPPTMAVEDTPVAVGRMPNKQDVADHVAELLGSRDEAVAPETEASEFGQGRAVVEGDRVFVCAEDFTGDEGCEPMLLFWYAEEGEAVTEGQELAEIESAKAVFVLQSPAAGVLEQVLVEAGGTIEPNQRLAVLRPVETSG
jgi:biotin carboxyl carrier protein